MPREIGILEILLLPLRKCIAVRIEEGILRRSNFAITFCDFCILSFITVYPSNIFKGNFLGIYFLFLFPPAYSHACVYEVETNVPLLIGLEL